MAIIYTVGELLVEIMRPEPNLPLNNTGAFIGPFPSGAPGIFISTAARLGHKTLIYGSVGSDKFGQNILERLKADGVDCSQINSSNKPTGVAFVSYDNSGEREFIFHINNTAADDFEFRAPQTIPECLHIMGCSLMASNKMHNEILQAFNYFSNKNVKVSFDPNIRPELLKERKFSELTYEIMNRCNIFLPGVPELMMATYDTDKFSENDSDIDKLILEAVNTLFDRYSNMEIINVKLGERGCIIFTRSNSPVHVEGYKISEKYPVVDPTGAGDCFDAAFVGAIIDKVPLEKAGFMAVKAGALNVIKLGPMEGDMSLILKKMLPEDEKFI